MGAGDRLRIETPGGGGYGKVGSDVIENGKVRDFSTVRYVWASCSS